jgi:hypothetical protein
MIHIHYFCHPLFNKDVPYFKKRKWIGEYVYVIELFDNSHVYLPEWMTDPSVCKFHELKEEPVCSLSALKSLQEHLKHL